MTTRRLFLKSSLATAGAASALSWLPHGRVLAADTSGYRALVCVFLVGGMDNFDTVIPYDTLSYDRYAEIRAPLLANYAAAGVTSRLRNNLRVLSPINSATFAGRQFALPAELSPIADLFDSGAAAIVGNVGPLVQEATRTELEADPTLLPPRLYSHNDQQSVWQSLEPEGSRFGWGGRFADTMNNAGANDIFAFSAITPVGNNVFLSGEGVQPYQVGSFESTTEHLLLSDTSPLNDQSKQAFRALIAANSRRLDNILERDVDAIQADALATNEAFSGAIANVADPLATDFPDTSIGRQLKTVADTINARSQLGASRQIFYVRQGGYDTHSSQARDLPRLHTQLAEGLAAFYQATQDMAVGQDVVTFTASDFGRTLAINGDGTDHGWGGHHFVIGDSVRGQRIYGTIPPADFDHALDDGGGRLIPSVSVQQYAGTMGSWFGLTSSERRGALPGSDNFAEETLTFL